MRVAVVVSSLLVSLSMIGCGEPSPREKSLKKERDDFRRDLDNKSTQNEYDTRFAERFLELTSAREYAWLYSNRYLVTPNSLLTSDEQSENRRAIQERNDKIAKLLLSFDLLVKEYRMSPPSSDTSLASAKDLSNASTAPLADLDAAVAKAREIRDYEKENFQEDSERIKAMSSDEKVAEAQNFVKRDAALGGLINAYESIKKALPRVVCATFAAQCKE